jgi:hypothetical protein
MTTLRRQINSDRPLPTLLRSVPVHLSQCICPPRGRPTELNSPVSRQPRFHGNLRPIARSHIRRNTAKIHRHNLSGIPTRSSTSTLLRQREVRSSSDVLSQVHSDMRRIESVPETFASSLRVREDMLCCQTSREDSGEQ